MDGNLCAERNRYRNDVHSGLNPTRHARVFVPESTEQVAELLPKARQAGQRIAVAGAQHAMGGQQFAEGGWLLDTRKLCGVLDFDAERGLVEVAAGTRWPQLQRFLAARRDATGAGWAIRQKQTGADDFSLGGSLAANIHGRCLDSPPLVADIEHFTLVTVDGAIRLVDRQREPELFALAVGGYGLFGVVTDLCLRLSPRRTLRREVSLLRRHELAAAFEQSRRQGASFGDFQFAIDPTSRDFLDLGVFACYHPQPIGTPPDADPAHLQAQDWRELLWLAHADKRAAFDRYSAFYLASDRQCYASDDHQFGVYLEGYHHEIDRRLGHRGSELITELYVPLDSLEQFLGEVAECCRQQQADVIYGTVRVVRGDDETALAWARQDLACIVLNLHVRHDAQGQQQAGVQMRALIDCALLYGGSFYLTYHRHARADQLRAAYPDIDDFLAAKQRLDPCQTLASDWYRSLQQQLGQHSPATRSPLRRALS